MRRFVLVSGFAALLCTLSAGVSFAQTGILTSPVPAAATAAQGAVVRSSNGPGLAIGATVGTLGIGVQAGTALTDRINVRGGFNLFSYNDTFTKDGVNYNATLNLQSINAKVDLFLIGGFRITPGVLLYNNNHLDANASVVAGRAFTLGGVTYFSSPNDPVKGTSTLTLNKVAPTIAIGFGDMLPRNRHFSLIVDLGAAYQGTPNFKLGLTGSACFGGNTNCAPVNSVPGLPANVINEQNKINNDLKPFKYYPDITIGVGYKF